MPLCIKHGVYIKPGDFCRQCNDEKKAEWDRSDKEKKKATVKRVKGFSRRSGTKTRLRDALQALYGKIMRAYYKSIGVYYCWIGGPACSSRKDGLFGLHISHFYAKGSLFYLWLHPVNSGVCCYHHNVVDQGTVGEMREMMIKVWGREKVEDLDKKAAMYQSQKRMGIIKSGPDEMWLKAMCSEIKGGDITKLFSLYLEKDS